ncbi:TetR/AcrR family transcriptional regulator [Ruania halotolerans]|uniref:TetR/AcrR family transcriptional regulator n=1 Tax=Ruania halotolerans TaxID=2897773 RepID=UPI001E5F31CB|nr:TetR/AcrR family transcriptional regulator [Ruania halotolerans]UFU07253.1 TetR/AcrR family transcriptional regulator [Ruania halotolerans]
MARTVDPQRHEARRLQIIDAAITVIAARGYERATTAAICREARIGSGTFFHYFPTKAELLVAILRLGTTEAEDLRTRLNEQDDPVVALDLVVEQAITDAEDPRVAGFVRAVATVMSEPAIAAALEAEEQAQRGILVECIVRAQQSGQVRTDLSADRLASWLRLLLDGFLEQIATAPAFTAQREGPVLREAVRAVLTGPTSVRGT